VFRDWRDINPWRVHVDDEQTDAVGAAVDLLARGRARDEDHVVRPVRERDPRLLPVEDVLVAVLLGAGGDVQRVRPGLRFGDPDGEVPLAVGDVRQVGLFLLFGPVLADADGSHACGEHQIPGAGHATALGTERLHRQSHLLHAHPCPVIFLGDQQPVEAGLGQFVPEP